MAIAARRGRKRGLSWGITKAERDTYREMLKTLDLGLEDRLTSKVGLLSGGQRQAITLLMASIQKPKLLLLDEHTAALDPKTAAKVLEISDKSKSGIIVKGLYDVAVHFSKCCSPVPGDEIVGFVTRGRGVSIHRTDCINIINLSDMERERLIDAEWQHDEESGNSGLYLAEIKVFCNNRTGLLVDITRAFTERAIDINAIHSKTSKQGIATIDISFNTKGKAELTSVIDKLRQIDSIIDIERTTG